MKPEKIQITTRTLNKLKFNKDGLIPTIVQDYKTKAVLMLAFMNLASLKKPLRIKNIVFGQDHAKNTGLRA